MAVKLSFRQWHRLGSARLHILPVSNSVPGLVDILRAGWRAHLVKVVRGMGETMRLLRPNCDRAASFLSRRRRNRCHSGWCQNGYVSLRCLTFFKPWAIASPDSPTGVVRKRRSDLGCWLTRSHDQHFQLPAHTLGVYTGYGFPKLAPCEYSAAKDSTRGVEVWGNVESRTRDFRLLKSSNEG